MPNNESRSRKLKCDARGFGQPCERCKLGELPCSLDLTDSMSRSYRAPEHSSSSQATRKPPVPIGPDPPIPGQTFPLSGTHSAFDVGYGSPYEILREGELLQSLILLYFNNFGDVHFMFDQSSFLRQYALGNVPKVVLFSMMALGIR